MHDAVATTPSVSDDGSRSDTGWFLGAIAFALLPIVVSTARAVHHHWLPMGDDAFFGIRAWDVFTRHIPLLGTWTSASLTLGKNVNNPGPLLWDLYAVPVRLFGTTWGVAVAAGLLNCLAVVGIALVARRRGGPMLGMLAMLVTAIMCWSMGSELLFDPWQPHSLLLPFLLFLMFVWTLSSGDAWALPWAVGVGSLLVQSHLTYAYLVPALTVWGVLGLVLATRHETRAESGGEWRRVLTSAGVAVVVFLACWTQPIIEQLTGDGEGNISRLVSSIGGSSGGVIGITRTLRLMAAVLSLPPFWFRPGFAHAFANGPGGPRADLPDLGVADLPSLGVAVASLLVLGGLLVAGFVVARRQRDRDAACALVTGALGIVVGLYTAATVPTTVLGIAPHQFRWLWPLAAFITFGLVATVLRASPWRTGAARGRVRPARAVLATLLVATGAFALLNLPTYRVDLPGEGPNVAVWSIAPMRDLDRQMGGLKGPLLYDPTGAPFAEPYSTAIMAELQRRGVEWVVDEPGLARQLGPGRRFAGSGARERIYYRQGDAALNHRPGERLVALHRGLSARGRARLARSRRRVVAYIASGRLRLNARGQAAVARGALVALRDAAGRRDPGPAMANGDILQAVTEDELDLDPRWKRRFQRYAELQIKWGRETVGVFVAPLADAS